MTEFMIPPKNDSDFFPGFLEGVLLDELSNCSQQRFPSIKIIKHRIPDQNINMSIFSCLLVIHLAWLDGIHSSDFMVRNLWPSEKNNPFLCLFSGALAAGFWECTWWLGIGIFHVQLHLHTKWINPSISSSMRGDGATQDLWSSVGSRRSSWGYRVVRCTTSCTPIRLQMLKMWPIKMRKPFYYDPPVSHVL